MKIRTWFLLLCLTPSFGLAAPEIYRLDAARSQVGFSYDLNNGEKTGKMPVKSAEIRIDLDDISKSQVSVTLNARGVRAGFILATQAMKSPEVLNTAQFPTIRFQSTRISGTLNEAKVSGDLTVRGITRPVTLVARLYRQRGTAGEDRDRLAILLTGEVSRSAFGASGFASYVGDKIGLRIIARIEK